MDIYLIACGIGMLCGMVGMAWVLSEVICEQPIIKKIKKCYDKSRSKKVA
jgi:hypothetical protein